MICWAAKRYYHKQTPLGALEKGVLHKFVNKAY